MLAAEDKALLAAIEDGLPLVAAPYDAIAEQLGWTREQVVGRLDALVEAGVARRFGTIIRHRALGITENAMVVWDVPDDAASAAGARLATLPYVTLAYRRDRAMPDWPYNLYCMIHGRSQRAVRAQIEDATVTARLDAFPRVILFSKRCFKQRGPRYQARAAQVA